MKNKFRVLSVLFVCLTASVPTLALAADAESVSRLSNRVNAMVQQNAARLAPSQLGLVTRLLLQIEQATVGHAEPIAPQPLRLCQNDETGKMTAAFDMIHGIAYSSEGLDMSDSNARQFAQQWLSQYPCSATTGYVRDVRALRSLAYSSEGLDMSSGNAAKYASEAIARRCYAGVDYVTEGRKLRNFAYSSSGLNMSSGNAAKYASEQMDRKYLHCSGIVE